MSANKASALALVANPVSELRTGVFSKLRALLPYFSGTHWAFALGALGAAFAAVCETGVAWLLVPLVDGGMKAIPIKFLADLPRPPLWAIPVALIVLFALRGAAGFVVDYTLAWAANAATLRLRSKLFARLLDGHPQLFVTRSASSLINTVVYEVLGGVNQLVGAAQTLLKDSFSVIAFLGTMLLLNWRLTLVIATLGPTVDFISSRRRALLETSKRARCTSCAPCSRTVRHAITFSSTT